MKILRAWFFACLAFGFYSLQTLVEESYEVNYENETETEPLQYLACRKLSDVYPNRTEIDLETIREGLYRYFSSSIFVWRKRDPKRFEELVLNVTLSGGYLIFNKMFCLIAKRMELIRIGSFIKSYPKKPVCFAIHKETFNFIQIRIPYFKIDQLTVVKSSYSNCDTKNARYHCLNECFKRHRLSKYYYESSETGTIRLNYSDRNQTISGNERNCSKKCKKENCKLVQLSLSDSFKPKSKTFEAQLRLSLLDYWIQLVGLLCFFSGLCFNQLVTIAIDFAESKTERRKVKIFLFYLKPAIILLSLAFCGCLCTLKVLAYTEQANNPKETEKPTNLIQQKIIRLAICVKIGENIDYRYMTMSEIENVTDGALDDVLEGIHLNYQDKLFRVDTSRSREVLFMYLRRCFILSIRPVYQPTLPNPKLRINFKKDKPFPPLLYLLSPNLTEKGFKFSGLFVFTKKEVKRLRSNGKCVDYKEKYKNCTSRWNCVDWCINRIFSEKYNKITYGIYDDLFGYQPVIDRNWFSSTEWKTLRLDINYMKYKLQILKNIIGECLKKIPEDEKPCNEIKFEQTYPIPETEEIDLQFEFKQSVEESPSFYKLALDLATIQGIFFGLTVFQLLKTINNFRSKLRPENNKIAQFLLYLLCLLGGSYHTYRIFDVIISDDLVPTRYYEMAKEMRLAVVFCNKINENWIDRNHKLTGNYLEQVTTNMTPESLFKNITYLNESNEWTHFNFSLAERFYYLDMKWFRIKIDYVRNQNQFQSLKDNQILRVNFTKAPNEENKFVYFMTETRKTGELSKIVKLKHPFSLAFKYSIIHLTSLNEYADRFSFIKKHFVWLKEDEYDVVLNKQTLGLQENPYNLKTLYLPVKEEDLHFELQDDLFQQLDSPKNKRKQLVDLNYKQLFVVNHLTESDRFGPDFSFNLNPLQKITFSTNEDNFGKLIVSLLNMLSVWFDLGVLDLHSIFVFSHDYFLVYLYIHLPIFLFIKLTQLLILSHNFLKKFELPLYKILEPRKQKSRKIPRPSSAFF